MSSIPCQTLPTRSCYSMLLTGYVVVERLDEQCRLSSRWRIIDWPSAEGQADTCDRIFRCRHQNHSQAPISSRLKADPDSRSPLEGTALSKSIRDTTAMSAAPSALVGYLPGCDAIAAFLNTNIGTSITCVKQPLPLACGSTTRRLAGNIDGPAP